MKVRLAFFLFLASLLAACVPAQSGVLDVEVGGSRGADDAMSRADQAVRKLTRNLSAAMSGPRDRLIRAGQWHEAIPFSLPVSVRLLKNGQPLPPSRGGGRSPGLTLSFDAFGARSFPDVYKQLLIDTFTQCEGTLNAVFGSPSVDGVVHVRNYDADIGDRHAVSGGYYVDNNGSNEREIRFPIYQNSEAAAVNFVHCLALAYLGPKPYGFDGFQEGLPRAATMRVVRTAGAMPASLDPGLIEQVLENTYDVGTWYDWNNQRALGGPGFIAANLVDVPLPPGGSIGGIYLLRYKMSGSAWQKIIAEYPAFIKLFNEGFYANSGIGNDRDALGVLGQNVLDTIGGAPNTTVEGKSFAAWMRRQFILENGLTLGRKLLIEPIPLSPQAGTSDFGVFLIQATYFETTAGGNETLLSGVSFPIFWSETFDRLFPSVQEDRMDIAGAYGSVVPNLPDLHGGLPYRCTVDIPVHDRLARVYVPAGAVATGANPTANDFYGTVTGVPLSLGETLRVRVTYGATPVDNIAVTLGAFGKKIDTASFLGYSRLHVEVIKTSGGNDTVVIDRFANKGPGPIALDLRPNDGEATFGFPGGLPKGLSTLGLPVEPWTSLFGDLLGIPESDVLAARWNGSKARYDIYPDCGATIGGNGFFIRLNAANPGFSVTGVTSLGMPVAVALRPGWNLISCPIGEAVTTNRVTVIHSVDFPETYAEAVGVELGADFFEFTPGANDPATGAPETGTMTAATVFQPGKAYFVRVLAAEGVTLLFSPQTSFRPGGPSNPQGGGFNGFGGDPSWTLKATISLGGHRSEAFLGQSRSATMGFDAREDSSLPPSMGGLQLALVNSEPRYRDARPLFARTTYRMKAVGLVPGKTYTVRMEYAAGSLKMYEFRDAGRAFRTLVRGPAPFTYTFRATGTERAFEVKVGLGGF